MSIAVTCPGCSAKLNAPDAAAGKKVKCPKPGCGAIVSVPIAESDFEVVEERPKARASRANDDDEEPRRKSRRVDEDDEYDDRPSKKKSKKKAGGLSPALIAAIAIGGVLILGGIGYGVYALVGKKPDSASGGGGGGSKKAAVPNGWVEYKSDADKFKGYFPKEVLSTPFKNPNRKLPQPRSINQYVSGSPTDGQFIVVYVAQLQPGSLQADKDAWAEDFIKSFRAGVNAKEGTATWAGLPAKEFVVSKPAVGNRPEAGVVVRQMTVGDTLYGAVFAQNNGQPAPDQLNGFFDNFELLK